MLKNPSESIFLSRRETIIYRRNQPANSLWTTQSTSQSVLDLAFHDGRYIAIGSDIVQGGLNIATSTDLEHWTTRVNNPGADFLVSLAQADGMTVAVGSNGLIMTSLDNGNNWSTAATTSTSYIAEVAYGHGRWVAVTLAGEALTSPDGLNWTTQEVNPDAAFADIDFGAGTFKAAARIEVPGPITTYNYVIYSSSDGLNWTQDTFNAHEGSQDFNLGYGNRFLAALVNVGLFLDPVP